jgi:hypothetical protein
MITLKTEIALTSTTRDQLTAVVQVYRAPGGGWERPETSSGGIVRADS